MKPRPCLWCGEEFAPRTATAKFCGRTCKDKAGNYMASRGKVLMPIALAWRDGTQGGKGKRAAQCAMVREAMGDMVRFLDACRAELSAQGSPPAKFYEASPDKWLDRQRVRPSRVVDEVPAEE